MSGIKTELLWGNREPGTQNLLFSPGLCLGHTLGPVNCLKTTAFKVPQIFSKEDPEGIACRVLELLS